MLGSQTTFCGKQKAWIACFGYKLVGEVDHC